MFCLTSVDPCCENEMNQAISPFMLLLLEIKTLFKANMDGFFYRVFYCKFVFI